jgi:small-conductance mechanosensitive channel
MFRSRPFQAWGHRTDRAVGGYAVGGSVLHRRGMTDDLATLAEGLLLPVAQVLALLVSAWLLRRILHRLVAKAVERRAATGRRYGDVVNSERVVTLITVVRSGITAAITAMTAVSVLSRIGVDTAPLLTGAGIIGVAVGLGTQHLVRDLVAGIILLLENQFNVGDEISAAGIAGRVENVTLRCIYLRADDGTLWALPSGEVKSLGNRSRVS